MSQKEMLSTLSVALAFVPASRLAARPPMMAVTATKTHCDDLLRTLFADGQAVDASRVASACSDSVTWVDMGLPEPLVGPSAVESHLRQTYPSGTKLVVTGIADGERSSGMAWHREADDVPDAIGLRGVTYVELDEAGEKIAYVQEGYESIFKLDKLLELVFKLFAAADKPGATSTATPVMRLATSTGSHRALPYRTMVAEVTVTASAASRPIGSGRPSVWPTTWSRWVLAKRVKSGMFSASVAQ